MRRAVSMAAWVVLGAGVVLLGHDARAASCTISWKDPVSGLWSDAARWDRGSIPASSDDVCIAVDGTYTVTLRGARTVASVAIGSVSGTPTLLLEGTPSTGEASVRASAVTNAGSMRLDSSGGTAGASIYLSNNALVNSGTFTVAAGTGGPRTLQVQIQNSGVFDLGAGIALPVGFVPHTNTGTFIIEPSASIYMAGGSVTPGGLWKQNGGTLDVRGSSRSPAVAEAADSR